MSNLLCVCVSLCGCQSSALQCCWLACSIADLEQLCPDALPYICERSSSPGHKRQQRPGMKIGEWKAWLCALWRRPGGAPPPRRPAPTPLPCARHTTSRPCFSRSNGTFCHPSCCSSGGFLHALPCTADRAHSGALCVCQTLCKACHVRPGSPPALDHTLAWLSSTCSARPCVMSALGSLLREQQSPSDTSSTALPLTGQGWLDGPTFCAY